MMARQKREKSTPSKQFKQLVHYILWYCKQDSENNLTLMTLNKILWMLDVWQYCREGHSMSGEEYYIKRKFGPVPLHILAALEALDTEGILKIKGYTKAGRIDIGKAEVTRPGKKDTRALGKNKLQQVRKFCNQLKFETAKELSDYSNDIVYKVYDDGERIPLAAYLVSKQVKPDEKAIAWAKKSYALYLKSKEASESIPAS